MSMMRASGAMLAITARQIATASFAVPKSVIKTIVGLWLALEFASFGEKLFAHPPEISAISKTNPKYQLRCSQSGIVIPLISAPQYIVSVDKSRGTGDEGPLRGQQRIGRNFFILRVSF